MIFKEEELTKKIIGLAMDVHNKLGPGFKEVIYQNAISVYLQKNNFQIANECPFKVYLDGCVVGNFRVDIIVNKKVILEIKAISGKMPQIFQAQLVSYLKASGVEIGLLLNFGNPSLEFQRVVYYNKSV